MNDLGTSRSICAETVPNTRRYIRGLPLTERIERLSIPEPMSGCWLWLGGTRTTRCGLRYGFVGVRGKTLRAHRVSFEAFKGPIPPKLIICHTCDNSLCVNPDHLYAGTYQDNSEDCRRRGRFKPNYGEKNGNAKITNQQASYVKWLLQQKRTPSSIAKEIGASLRTVQSISWGEKWKSVGPIPYLDGGR